MRWVRIACDLEILDSKASIPVAVNLKVLFF